MLENILDYLRIGLYILLALVCYSLYQAWQTEHHPPLAANTTTQTLMAEQEATIPTLKETATTHAAATAGKTESVVSPEGNFVPAARIIHVKTDLLEVDIDALGGDIISSKLLNYPESLHSQTPFVLLNNDGKNRYIAQSGLLGSRGPDSSKGKALYKPEKQNYLLAEGEKEFIVKLSWQKDGVNVSKSFVFHRNDYEVDVVYNISNDSATLWEGNAYNQLLRTDNPPPNGQGFSSLTTYFGAAISSPEKPFQKISFKDMREKSLNQAITGGWAAMVQHYFVTAWVPDKVSAADYYTKVTPNGLYTVGLIGSKVSVGPHEKKLVQSKLYTGPALADRLEKAAPGLQLTIDYGIFWFISVAIFWVMQHVHDVIGNWGWAIVITTLIIKLLFFHLSAKSYRSMSKLKKVQPRMERLKELHGNDRQKLTQATLDLYRQEKVNPMGGCLPILIQIPVFIALYWVLVESVQLRQAPFILWIHDLTAKDPFYILPVLVGISMFLQQRLSPPPPDPTQAKVMMFMPVIFTALFINFPAGLMLYWFVNNLLSFLQQWYIMRTVK